MPLCWGVGVLGLVYLDGGGILSEREADDGAGHDGAAGQQLLAQSDVAGVDADRGEVPCAGIGAELFDVGALRGGLEVGVVDVLVQGHHTG